MNFISHMPFPRSISNHFHCWLNLFGFFSFSRSISVILVVFLVVSRRLKKSFSSKSCPFSRRFVLLASYYPIKLFLVMQILFIHPEHFRSCFLSRSSGGHLFGRFLHSKFSDSFSNYSISVPFRSTQYSPSASFKYSSISSRSLRSFASKSPLAYWLF